MSVNLFQIVLGLMSTLCLLFYLKKTSSLFDYSFLFFNYALFNLFLFKPTLLIQLSQVFGIGRGVDIFLYSSIILLLFFVIRLRIKIEKNKEDISMLTRKIAILFMQNDNPLKKES